MPKSAVNSRSSWAFLTNHGHVLLCIARDRRVRVRDIAIQVDITERAVQRIIADLIDEGYLSRTRAGRRNVYRINRTRPLPHPLEQGCRIGEVLAAFLSANG